MQPFNSTLCHLPGIHGAPKVGDREDWARRVRPGMTMVFRKFPSTPMFGCSVLRLHEDGRIASQRDYYDLWGDIMDGIPFLRRLYRAFMRRFFG